MSAPFEARIAAAAEVCVLALRQHRREIAAVDVDNHFVVVAKGDTAKKLAESLELETPTTPTRVPGEDD